MSQPPPPGHQASFLSFRLWHTIGKVQDEVLVLGAVMAQQLYHALDDRRGQGIAVHRLPGADLEDADDCTEERPVRKRPMETDGDKAGPAREDGACRESRTAGCSIRMASALGAKALLKCHIPD